LPRPVRRREIFQNALLAGERGRIYPILQYVLSRLPLLKKRAYVAKFLLDVQVPPEYMHDETTQTLLEQMRDLQEEFRETHKAVDAMRDDATDPGELKREITQLESEKRQLLGRIDSLKTKTSSLRGFQAVFDATSALRKEQEQEAKLADRLGEQRAALAEAEAKHRAAARRLAEARAKSRADATAEDLVAAARREAKDHATLLDKSLPQALESRRSTLARLQEQLSGPRRSMDDVSRLQSEVRGADGRLADAVDRLARREEASGDSRLGLFWKQSLIVVRKLQDKAVEVEGALRAVGEARTEVERREARLAEMAGARHMRREDFAAYAASVRTKLQDVKRLKAEQADTRAETAVLGRTEQILKSRAGSETAPRQSRAEHRGPGRLAAPRPYPNCPALRRSPTRTPPPCAAPLPELPRPAPRPYPNSPALRRSPQTSTRSSPASRSVAACRGTPSLSQPSTSCPARRSTSTRPRGPCSRRSPDSSATSRHRSRPSRRSSRSSER